MATTMVPDRLANVYREEVEETVLAVMAAGVSYDRIAIVTKVEYSCYQGCHIYVGSININEENHHGT